MLPRHLASLYREQRDMSGTPRICYCLMWLKLSGCSLSWHWCINQLLWNTERCSAQSLGLSLGVRCLELPMHFLRKLPKQWGFLKCFIALRSPLWNTPLWKHFYQTFTPTCTLCEATQWLQGFARPFHGSFDEFCLSEACARYYHKRNTNIPVNEKRYQRLQAGCCLRLPHCIGYHIELGIGQNLRCQGWTSSHSYFDVNYRLEGFDPYPYIAIYCYTSIWYIFMESLKTYL